MTHENLEPILYDSEHSVVPWSPIPQELTGKGSFNKIPPDEH